eukprot:216073-Amphidinium_carterae.1
MEYCVVDELDEVFTPGDKLARLSCPHVPFPAFTGCYTALGGFGRHASNLATPMSKSAFPRPHHH